jgi:hypothetical protein
MVFEDISVEKTQSPKWHPADPLERFFAFCLDITLLTPLIAFVCSIHMREIENDITQGFDSGLWLSLLTTGLFSSVSLQTLFFYFYSATPGQSMLNLKVQSLENENLSWGDSFTRSFTFHLSGLLLFIPFIEVFTHRIGRCLHDRVSDSIVIQPYPKSQKPLTLLQINNLKMVTLLGLFFSILIFIFQISERAAEPLSLIKNSELPGHLDSFTAKAVLLKNFDSETQEKIDQLLWKSKSNQDRDVAYYFRWRATQDKDEKTLILAKICQVEDSLFCRILNSKTKKIDVKTIRSQTALVALLNTKAEISDFQAAFEAYDALKKYRSLNQALKVWDVGLFLKLEKALKNQRSPASEDFKTRLEEFKNERVID